VSLWLEAREPSSSIREIRVRVSFKPVPGGYDFADTVRFTIVRVLIAVGDTEADTDDVVPVAGTRKVTLHFSPSEMLRPANHGPLTVYLSPRPRGNSPAWVQIVDERRPDFRPGQRPRYPCTVACDTALHAPESDRRRHGRRDRFSHDNREPCRQQRGRESEGVVSGVLA
jgi:hypothetical protein